MYTILIVDDESIILEGIKEVIKDSGLPFKDIQTASSASEALQLYEKNPFDILLTDINMPQMNGIDMVEAMRKIWPYTEVIFLTGFQDFDYVRGALRLRGFDYLLKPMPDEELLEHLKTLVLELDHRWGERFVYDSTFGESAGESQDEIPQILLQQMEQGKNDFERLKSSKFPFDPERNLRIIMISYQENRSENDLRIHEWITTILRKVIYGYGYVSGFLMQEGMSAFLIQKLEDSEELFTGVYKALEEMQEYFYTKLDVRMTISVSHRTQWGNWIRIARGMKERLNNPQQYGGIYTYDADTKEEEADGNLFMYKIRDYIIQNPGADLSLGSLSQRFRINPSYLSRSFHQTIQISISTYITNVRIEEAKRLLKETDTKIYEIAQKVGFETQGYFTKVFNKSVGMTPKEYRLQ